MSKVLVEESNLTAIASAIRTKLGVQTTYKPGQMATAIQSIAPQPSLETKSIVANGTYTPASGKDGFSEVTVNVPNSYAAGDEGKVVSNGALVAQTARASEITANGTYDTTGNNSVTVNVSGGGNVYTNAYAPGAQITDISGFTKIYDSSIPYGNSGTRVATALEVTNESTLNTNMSGGWNASNAAYYDSEHQKGAYAGYTFGEALKLSLVKLWLGRYSNQNNTLYATVEYLDSNNNWNELKDLEIPSTLQYPTNVFQVFLPDVDLYGIRWIHKKDPAKDPGNNIVFFGMTLYSQSTNAIYIAQSSGLINPPSGYIGFGPLYII